MSKWIVVSAVIYFGGYGGHLYIAEGATFASVGQLVLTFILLFWLYLERKRGGRRIISVAYGVAFWGCLSSALFSAAAGSMSMSFVSMLAALICAIQYVSDIVAQVRFGFKLRNKKMIGNEDIWRLTR